MKNVLSIKNLSYSYDKDKVLEDINLEVQENDFLAIIGPNGGGKSTLLKLIVGLLKSDKDAIHIFMRRCVWNTGQYDERRCRI